MRQEESSGLRAVALLGAATLCVPASNPPHGHWLFALLGPLLLAGALRHLSCARHAFWAFLASGALAMATTVPWLFRLFPPQVPPALFVLFGLFHAVFGALAWSIFYRCRGAVSAAVLCAAWWTVIEFYRSEWFVLPYPWITPGIAFGPTRLSPLVGVYGATFLAVFAGFACASATSRGVGTVTMALLAGLALWRPAAVTPSNPIRVAAVQAEVAPLDRYLELSDAATNRPHLIVWPEASVPLDVRQDAPHQFKEIQEFAASRGLTLVFGTQTRTGDGERDWWNTALVVDAAGVRGEHHKNRPVPLFNDGRPGRDARAILTEFGPAGTPICFDGDSPGVMRRMAASGATFFAVPSMDAASWSAFEHEQHAALIRLRAAECGRWVVVAASSGLSQIVDPHGRVHGWLPALEEGVLCGEVGRISRTNFFVRVGWLFPYALIALAVFGTLRICCMRRKVLRNSCNADSEDDPAHQRQ